VTTTAPTTVNGLQLRARMGRRTWGVPQRFGPDGWSMDTLETATGDGEPAYDAAGRPVPVGRIIVTTAPSPELGGVEVTHASISRRGRMPTYDDLCALHFAVWGDGGWAYQVFAPPEHHVNIHPTALHLWGRADGAAMLPNFGMFGTI